MKRLTLGFIILISTLAIAQMNPQGYLDALKVQMKLAPLLDTSMGTPTISGLGIKDSDTFIEIGNPTPIQWWYDQFMQPTILEKKEYMSTRFLKIVASITIPVNMEEYINQLNELRYFRSLGYDAAIITHYGEDNLYLLGDTMTKAKEMGYTLVFAPSFGRDGIYLDPDIYRRAYQLIVPECEFVISSWIVNGSGYRMWKEETKMKRDVNVIFSLIREVNPDIPIVGSIRYSPKNPASVTFSRYLPEFTTGSVLQGAGFHVNRVTPRVDSFFSYTVAPTFVEVTGVPPWGNKNLTTAFLYADMKFVEKIYEDSGLYAGSILLLNGNSTNRQNNLTFTQHHLNEKGLIP